MSDLLIEILTEELPARFITEAQTQMADRVALHLNELSIEHGDVHSFSTPRRLVVLIQAVKEQTQSRIIDVKGPAASISYDSQGNPTPALEGFCRGQGVSIADIRVEGQEGKQYVYARKTVPSRQTSELIESFLSHLPREITFPKMMRWEESGFQFARPIRGLTALFGTEVLRWEIADVQSSNTTFGLRIGKPKALVVSSPQDYMKKLREAFVIVDPSERRRSIEKQSEKVLKPLDAKLANDSSDLLDEVVNLIEYPSVFLGNLPDIAVELPESVVRSVLQQQMHSFLVYDQHENVLPYFLGVRNGLTDFIDTVRKGNESVAKARLMDASFFMQEDMRLPLEAYVSRLDTLIFMDALGTMADKTLRLEQLSAAANTYTAVTPEERAMLMSAAHLSKADLATNMVKEYTSLQGEIGSMYLHRASAPTDIVTAVREQYVPRSPTEDIAQTKIGRLLGIIDKVDTITGILGMGFNPSGSEDPYGLRRAGNGVIRTIIESGDTIDLEILVTRSIDIYLAQGILSHPDELLQRVLAYLKGRILQYFREKHLANEFAPFESLPLSELGSVPERMSALREVRSGASLLVLADSHRRIQNITKDLPDVVSLPSDLLLTEPEEIELRRASEDALPRILQFLTARQYRDAIKVCESLTEPITLFFDRVLVMAPDENVRRARLLLLCYVKYILGRVCDYSKLT
ncbi:MAG: glycine--tRNA ligase subunit beta [Candidatus Cryosericum sp.]